ncbi:MAG: glycerol-3-phosphate 1-O-acyltransferase PlsY [Desulfovibrionaceae bacterium]|jgi:glycerol-3-phosphate acyltransferase PlsY|nr:glycerol-3-phosphate 1-O-acyltransferase PlsY [Desulfovibrionaceae bacterium]
MLVPLLATLAAYLAGSLSFAVIVSRSMGLSDPRTYGSGNPGATNVLRSGSKAAALVTLALDALKGWLPVMLIQWFGAAHGLGEGAQALAGVAAFLGHLYPVFFRFAGGKGVATAAGVLLAFNPWLGAVALLTWLIAVALTRYVSLASMAAAALAPGCYLMGDGLLWQASGEKTLAMIVMGLLLIWRHRQNIQRLTAGAESKLGSKKA